MYSRYKYWVYIFNLRKNDVFKIYSWRKYFLFYNGKYDSIFGYRGFCLRNMIVLVRDYN